ncbi:MAG: gamma-glutamylcyclotransferase family protein [Gemmataceae bacterium]
MAGKTILFVYGTLKRGERNHSRIAAGEFLGDAVTPPLYRVYDLGAYPGLVRDEADGLAVRGELWAVGGPTLAALDEFEEVPDLFVRRPVTLTGCHRLADAYFFNRPVPAGTPSGDRWPLL